MLCAAMSSSGVPTITAAEYAGVCVTRITLKRLATDVGLEGWLITTAKLQPQVSD